MHLLGSKVYATVLQESGLFLSFFTIITHYITGVSCFRGMVTYCAETGKL